MKKYILSLLILAACATFSCSKLEIAPRGEMADKELAYKHPVIRGQILAGLYSTLMREETWGAFISIRLEAPTDVLVSRIAGANRVEPLSTQTNAPEVAANWKRLYNGINACNEFVYYSERFVEPGVMRTRELAEARFLRAYFYFTLVRLYGDVPLRSTPTLDLDHTDIARTSAVDVYDFIVKELGEVQQVLPKPSEAVYGHIANTAAQAALADVYLNLGGMLMKDRLPADSTRVLMHQRAAAWCRKVIENGDHDIAATGYDQVFINQVQGKDNIKEQIWEIQFKYLNPGSTNAHSRVGTYNGMGGDVKDVYKTAIYTYPNVTLRALYSKVDGQDDANRDVDPKEADAVKLIDNSGDIRAGWNCPYRKIANTSESKLGAPAYALMAGDKRLYNCGKWRKIYTDNAAEAVNTNFGGCRLSIYRISDVHLMLAEALNFGDNDQAGALDQVNIVRKRAGATLVTGTLSKDEVFDLIVDERARELCFEGKRRIDLIRWGIYEKKLQASALEYTSSPVTGDSYKGLPLGFTNFNPEAHYILPIPQDELDRNVLIPMSEQNEGWGGNRKWK